MDKTTLRKNLTLLFAAAIQKEECQAFFTRRSLPVIDTLEDFGATARSGLLPQETQIRIFLTNLQKSLANVNEGSPTDPQLLLEKFLAKTHNGEELRNAIELALREGDLPEIRELAEKTAPSLADSASIALWTTSLLCLIAAIVFIVLGVLGAGGGFAALPLLGQTVFSIPALACLGGSILSLISVAFLRRFVLPYINESKTYTPEADILKFIEVFQPEKNQWDPDTLAEDMADLSNCLLQLFDLEKQGLTLKKGLLSNAERAAFKPFVAKKENLRILTELAKGIVPLAVDVPNAPPIQTQPVAKLRIRPSVD